MAHITKCHSAYSTASPTKRRWWHLYFFIKLKILRFNDKIVFAVLTSFSFRILHNIFLYPLFARIREWELLCYFRIIALLAIDDFGAVRNVRSFKNVWTSIILMQMHRSIFIIAFYRFFPGTVAPTHV